MLKKGPPMVLLSPLWVYGSFIWRLPLVLPLFSTCSRLQQPAILPALPGFSYGP